MVQKTKRMRVGFNPEERRNEAFALIAEGNTLQGLHYLHDYLLAARFAPAQTMLCHQALFAQASLVMSERNHALEQRMLNDFIAIPNHVSFEQTADIVRQLLIEVMKTYADDIHQYMLEIRLIEGFSLLVDLVEVCSQDTAEKVLRSFINRIEANLVVQCWET